MRDEKYKKLGRELEGVGSSRRMSEKRKYKIKLKDNLRMIRSVISSN